MTTKQNRLKKKEKNNEDEKTVIKKLSSPDIPKSMLKIMSPEAKKALEKNGAKEIGTNNMAVGEWFVIERYLPGNYHKFATDGSRSELSVFRMVGGDSLPDEAILWLPDNFGKAVEIIEQKYIGRKLRVVARSADGMDQYGHRYYLFAVE